MPFHRPSTADVAPAPVEAPDRPGLSDLERAILLTVLYADLFDYPLTRDELYRRLVETPCDRAAFERALDDLVPAYLDRASSYLTWAGRTHLADVRTYRLEMTEDLWQTARRYARWLARIPFVRMVAVSGSLAVNNAEAKSDVDFFCITTPNRLWLARAWIVPLSKLTGWFPKAFPLYLCPNYILALDELHVEDHNLFTAHEVAQTVPLWGLDVYRRFLQANRWVYDFLPHTRFDDHLHRAMPPPRPWFTRGAERLLRGRMGDALDRLIYRLFLTFYRRRAERAGWNWARLQQAYRRNRYTVPEGGYARVIYRLFVRRVRERLGAQVSKSNLARIFALPDDESVQDNYDWAELFARDYGV
ncbi:MAG: hypothetical protein ACE5G0_00105 [Rhodothermales bacterium]